MSPAMTTEHEPLSAEELRMLARFSEGMSYSFDEDRARVRRLLDEHERLTRELAERAAERDVARADLGAADGLLRGYVAELYGARSERDAARAEVERLRAEVGQATMGGGGVRARVQDALEASRKRLAAPREQPGFDHQLCAATDALRRVNAFEMRRAKPEAPASAPGGAHEQESTPALRVTGATGGGIGVAPAVTTRGAISVAKAAFLACSGGMDWRAVGEIESALDYAAELERRARELHARVVRLLVNNGPCDDVDDDPDATRCANASCAYCALSREAQDTAELLGR